MGRYLRRVLGIGCIAAVLLAGCDLTGDDLPSFDLSVTATADYDTPLFFESAVITLTTNEDNANIHFTTDDRLPTTSSERYSDPIVISETTRIRARAFKDGTSGNPIDVTFSKAVEHDETVTLNNQDAYLVIANPSTNSPYKGFTMLQNPVDSSTSYHPATSHYEPSTQNGVTAGETSDFYRSIQEFNRTAVQHVGQTGRTGRSAMPRSASTTDPSWDTGTTRDMYINNQGATVPTTLREKRTKSLGNGAEVTLYIWVEDASWHDGGTKSYTLDQNQIDILADRFLHPDESAIYEWVVDIAGEPWGSHPYNDVIPPGEAEHIHIVLKDIGGDDSTGGGVVGYFWAIHNLLADKVSWLPGSNEGLYFFMDSVRYASGDGSGSWSADSGWPPVVFSTLAHEFQHMIHWYQKSIVHGLGTETWLDEMASMAVEDLVADKLEVAGPRGLPQSGGSYDYSTGSSNFGNGSRLSYYNAFTNYQLTFWGNSLIDYGKSYALGAYLMRAYTGHEIIRDIVQAADSGQGAIVQAVSTARGGSVTFGEILLDFGEAVLRSYDETAGEHVRMNHGSDGSSYTVSGAAFDYRLGSIDLYNVFQLDSGTTGPMTIPVSMVTDSYEFNPGTKYLIELGTGLSGDYTWEFALPDEVEYRLVTIDSKE